MKIEFRDYLPKNKNVKNKGAENNKDLLNMKIDEIFDMEENVRVPAELGEANHKALKDNRDAVISGIEQIVLNLMNQKDTDFIMEQLFDETLAMEEWLQTD